MGQGLDEKDIFFEFPGFKTKVPIISPSGGTGVRVRTVTSEPSAASFLLRKLPMKPLPPAMTMRRLIRFLRVSDDIIRPTR